MVWKVTSGFGSPNGQRMFMVFLNASLSAEFRLGN